MVVKRTITYELKLETILVETGPSYLEIEDFHGEDVKAILDLADKKTGMVTSEIIKNQCDGETDEGVVTSVIYRNNNGYDDYFSLNGEPPGLASASYLSRELTFREYQELGEPENLIVTARESFEKQA